MLQPEDISAPVLTQAQPVPAATAKPFPPGAMPEAKLLLLRNAPLLPRPRTSRAAHLGLMWPGEMEWLYGWATGCRNCPRSYRRYVVRTVGFSLCHRQGSVLSLFSASSVLGSKIPEQLWRAGSQKSTGRFA